jgi:hypothetical protein
MNPALFETGYDSEQLSAQDSLALYKEGIIDVKPKSIMDTVPQIQEQPQRRRR